MKRLFGVLSLLLVLTVGIHAAPPFRAIDLGTLGGFFSGAEAVSNNGVVVGYSELESGEQRAFVWTQGTGMVDIGPLSDCCSRLSVSDNGVWVGGNTLVPGTSSPRAFVWSQASGMIDISEGLPLSWVRGVNNQGMAIGEWALPTDVVAHAFVWTPSTGMIELGADLDAVALNNRGVVVVNRSAGTGGQRALVWTLARGLMDLDSSNEWDTTEATAINADGTIVGGATRCDTVECVTHAFRWTRPRGLVDIDRGRSGRNTTALGIGDQGLVAGRLSGGGASHVFVKHGGQLVDIDTLGGDGTEFWALNDDTVVGISQVQTGFGHPFAWTRKDGMVDLGGLGGVGVATDINADDLIVGQSCTVQTPQTSRVCHAFLWVPTDGPDRRPHKD